MRLGDEPTAARFEDGQYILDFADGSELRGDRLLVATGRRPRVDGIGLETAVILVEGDVIAVESGLPLRVVP